MHQRRRVKRQQDIQRILEDFKGVRNIPGIKSAKKKELITKIKKKKTTKGECITSRNGIADVFGEFHKRHYEDNEKDDSDHEVDDDDNYSSTDVHNNNTEETAGIPEITTEELQNAINNLKKANPQTAKEFEPKTLKHVMRR